MSIIVIKARKSEAISVTGRARLWNYEMLRESNPGRVDV
jgi:hypothetical protein